MLPFGETEFGGGWRNATGSPDAEVSAEFLPAPAEVPTALADDDDLPFQGSPLTRSRRC